MDLRAYAAGLLLVISDSSVAHVICLNGLGQNWEDIEAKKSTPNVEVLGILKDRGELRADEVESWYEDETGRVVYCRGRYQTWNSFLFERIDGKWRQNNAISTTVD